MSPFKSKAFGEALYPDMFLFIERKYLTAKSYINLHILISEYHILIDITQDRYGWVIFQQLLLSKY